MGHPPSNPWPQFKLPFGWTQLKSAGSLKGSLQGRLTRVFGGETTGWAVQVVSSSGIEQFLEIDPTAGRPSLDSFSGKQVQIAGTLTWRHGEKRGEYPVLLADEIREWTENATDRAPPID